MVWHPDLNFEKGFVLESLVLARVRSNLSAQLHFDATLEGQVFVLMQIGMKCPLLD